MQAASENKAGRQKISGDPKTRELLRRLITDGKTLEPEIGADGLVHYPLAEEAIGDPKEAEAWIEEMLASGTLKKTVSRELVTCPTHMRADPLIQLECVKCKARKMRKTTLVEHLYCGYIDSDSKFDKDGFLVCPNCKRAIRSADELRSSGVWYECQNCLTKTSVPKVVFACREGHEFGTNELRLATAYSYVVDNNVVAQLKNTLVLAPALATMLARVGYEIQSPAVLQGRSGTSHTLDVYGRKREAPGSEVTDIAIQIAVDSVAVDPSAVISFFAKTYDLKPKLSVLVAIPAASEAARQINAGYGITIVEDPDGAGVVKKVMALLEAPTPARTQ